jgi:hypothetical protein
MLVVGSGIPIGSTINSFVVVANVVQSITLNQVVTGSGSISINIFGRKFGSAQDDMLESHAHGIHGTASNQAGGGGAGDVVGTSTAVLSSAVGGLETRPRNQAVMYVIKAFATVTNPGLIDVADLANDITALQNSMWVSPIQTFTQNSVGVGPNTSKISIPHTMGSKPKKVTANLVCKQAIGAYAVGDWIQVENIAEDTYWYGIHLKWDSVNITYRIAAHGFIVADLDQIGTASSHYHYFNTVIMSNYFDFVLVAEK